MRHDGNISPVEPPPVLAYEEPPPPLTGVGLVAFVVFLSLVGFGAALFAVIVVWMLFVD